MSRKFLSNAELCKWLDDQIQLYDQCKNCRFKSITPLNGYDDSGCNWSDCIVNYGGDSKDICSPSVQAVIAKAKEMFNLAD